MYLLRSIVRWSQFAMPVASLRQHAGTTLSKLRYELKIFSLEDVKIDVHNGSCNNYRFYI